MELDSSRMRILIADDHDMVRDMMVAFLRAEGVEAETAATLNGALTRIEDDPDYDLVLLDYRMPGMNGLDGLCRALEGGVRVALMSGEATPSIAERALEAGAAGFVPKTLAARSMVNAIRFMAMGEQYVPVDFMNGADHAESNPLAANLTPRELQVLKGLTEGKSNKEIARDLDISEPTVKLHVKTLYRKIGAANRTRAALIAREAGLF